MGLFCVDCNWITVAGGIVHQAGCPYADTFASEGLTAAQVAEIRRALPGGGTWVPMVTLTSTLRCFREDGTPVDLSPTMWVRSVTAVSSDGLPIRTMLRAAHAAGTTWVYMGGQIVRHPVKVRIETPAEREARMAALRASGASGEARPWEDGDYA